MRHVLRRSVRTALLGAAHVHARVRSACACAPMRMRVGAHDARCAVGRTGDHGAVQHEADAPGAHCCVRTAPYQRELPPPARHTIAPDSDGDNCQRAPPLTLLAAQCSEVTGCPDITCCIKMQHTCCGGRRTLQQCCAGAPVRPCCGRSGSTFRRRPTHRRSANATSLCCDRSRTAPRSCVAPHKPSLRPAVFESARAHVTRAYSRARRRLSLPPPAAAFAVVSRLRSRWRSSLAARGRCGGCCVGWLDKSNARCGLCDA
jgi:hypothetical protein